MEGVSLVLFIQFYMKAQFGLVIEIFYNLSFTNQYFFIFCIMVQDFMTNIYQQKIGENILMMMEVLFSQKYWLESGTMQD